MIKGTLDGRVYESIRLQNQARVMVVNDQRVPYSQVSLVFAGEFFQGDNFMAANILEMSMMLGGEGGDDFYTLTQETGSHYQSSTDFHQQRYQLECDNNHLSPLLQMLSSRLCHPDITPDKIQHCLATWKSREQEIAGQVDF